MAYKDPNDERARRSRRDWYYRNKAKQRATKDARDQRIREWYRDLKAGLRCAHCPATHPACLEFHHTDPSKKEIAISCAVANNGWSVERIEKEIEKCIVLCKNCHAILHWDESQEIGHGDRTASKAV